jgi:hypothetical protein
MTAITFDTHKIHKNLVSKGFSEQQAEALLETITQADAAQLVTKTDLQNSLKDLEQRMTIKLGALIVVGVGFLAAIKFFG